MEEIADLEYEFHKKSKRCVYLAIERAGTYICYKIDQNTNFTVGLSSFGCEVTILYKQHIVHWSSKERGNLLMRLGQIVRPI